jgi:hypothetical protein
MVLLDGTARQAGGMELVIVEGGGEEESAAVEFLAEGFWQEEPRCTEAAWA